MGTKSFIKGAATALGVIGAVVAISESGVLDDLDLFGFTDSDDDDSDKSFFGDDDDDESDPDKDSAKDKNPETSEESDGDFQKVIDYVREFYFSEPSGKHAKKLKKKLHKLALRSAETCRKYEEVFGDKSDNGNESDSDKDSAQDKAPENPEKTESAADEEQRDFVENDCAL